MRTHDSLGRRNLVVYDSYDGIKVKRIPSDKPVSLQSRDIEICAFAHRHGGYVLPTYPHKLLSDSRTPQYTKKRFTPLFHDLKLLDYVILNRRAENDKALYKLGTEGKKLLEANGLLFSNTPNNSDSVQHDVMLSCVSGTFETDCKNTPYTYHPQHKVVDSPYIEIGGDKVYPDCTFMLEREGKKLLVFLEVDRATEASHSTRRKSSWTWKLKMYKKIIGDRLYKEIYNHDGGAVLCVVTVHKAKQESILAEANRVIGKCPYILVTYESGFGVLYNPPEELKMLTRTWMRNGYNDWHFLK